MRAVGTYSSEWIPSPFGIATGARFLQMPIPSDSDVRRAAFFSTSAAAAMPKGSAALILLRRFHHVVVRCLLEQTVAGLVFCSAACTALHNAARQGNAEGVRALLAEGSDVHAKDAGG